MPSSYVIGDHFESFIKEQIQQGRYAVGPAKSVSRFLTKLSCRAAAVSDSAATRSGAFRDAGMSGMSEV